MPSPPTSKRASSRPAVTSSRRIAPGARAAQQAHAAVDHLARPPTRPRSAPGRSRPPSARRAARARMRQRAARGARRLIGRLAAVGQRDHHRAVGQRVQPRAVRRAPSSSSSASSAAQLRLGTASPSSSAALGSPAMRRRVARASAARPWPTARRCTTQAIRCSLAVERRGARGRARRRAAATSRRAAPSASSAATTAARVGRPLRRVLGQHARDQVVERARHAAARASRTRGASSSRILASSAVASSPSNAGRPVRHSNSTQPSENTSARASTSRSPRACSGAM